MLFFLGRVKSSNSLVEASIDPGQITFSPPTIKRKATVLLITDDNSWNLIKEYYNERHSVKLKQKCSLYFTFKLLSQTEKYFKKKKKKTKPTR